MQSPLLMNHAVKSNHPLESIYVNTLDHLGLSINLLSSLTHREDEPPLHKEGLVEADVNVTRVRPDCVWLAIFFSL